MTTIATVDLEHPQGHPAADLEQRRLRQHRLDHRAAGRRAGRSGRPGAGQDGARRRHRHRPRRHRRRAGVLPDQRPSTTCPTLIDTAQRRAQAEGLDIDFEVGDAEALPYADGRFDYVLSAIGTMFTADHQQAADETVRVTRPGGRIGLASWTPTGFVGRMLKTVGKYVAPPAGALPPTRWGDPQVIAELFGDKVEDLRTWTTAVRPRFLSAEHYADFFLTNYGPTFKAASKLDAAEPCRVPRRPRRPGRGVQPGHRRHLRLRVGVPPGLRPTSADSTTRRMRQPGSRRASHRELPALVQVDRVHERPVQGLGLERAGRLGPGLELGLVGVHLRLHLLEGVAARPLVREARETRRDGLEQGGVLLRLRDGRDGPADALDLLTNPLRERVDQRQERQERARVERCVQAFHTGEILGLGHVCERTAPSVTAGGSVRRRREVTRPNRGTPGQPTEVHPLGARRSRGVTR